MSDGCAEEALKLLDIHQGMVLGEVHGDYAHARFVRDLMSKAAARGVKHLYVEMFQQPLQGMIDLWQESDRPHMLVEHINNKRFAYSTYNWAHYWEILQAAKAAGIRVTAVEPAEVPDPGYPGLLMMVRNIGWQKCIDKSQAEAPGKYILYCGRGHLDARQCGDQSTMQKMMKIPGVSMLRGLPGFVPSIRNSDLHRCWLPKAADQTYINGLQREISAKIDRNTLMPVALAL